MKQEIISLYFYRNDDLVNVKRGMSTVTVLRSFDVPLVQHDTDAEVGTTFLATTDSHSVLKARGQKKEESHSYTAYGGNSSLPSKITLSGFNGRYLEWLSDCYNLGEGYRSYSPSLMRFLSPDSFSPFGIGGRNAYAYCLDDPINRVDPTGHLSLLKPRTWFRSTAKKIEQRTATLNTLKNDISTLTSEAESTNQKQSKGYDITRGRAIKGLVKSINEKTAAYNKKVDGINKYLPEDEHRQHLDTFSITDKGRIDGYRQKIKTKDSNLFALPKDRSHKDQYDDNNWISANRDNLRKS